MSDFSLDPSLTPKELLAAQTVVKKQVEPDLKKFESEMKKIKTDADQKKQRKREEEENEGSKKIIKEAQELIKQREDSLYALQKPNIKTSLKIKKTSPQDENPKPFLLPSLNQASLLFQKNDFTLNLSQPPSEWIERAKVEQTLGLQGFAMPLLDSTQVEDITSFSLTSKIGDLLSPPPPLKQENDLQPKDILAPLEEIEKKYPKKTTEEDIKKYIEDHPNILTTPPPLFLFSIPEDTPTSPSNLHRLSPDAFALFERIVGVITVIQNKGGISQTTINLNQPQFAASIFFGSQITIEECDTAPQEFNIRFCGKEEAVKAFFNHKKELETALTEGFEKKRFCFKVQRIETDLSTN